jgi:transcription termination factor NusB
LKSLYQSFLSNYDHIKGLIDSEILKKTNKITIFLIYAFFSEYLINKEKKKILIGEYIKLSKDFLTIEEVKYFNYLLDDISKKAP